MSSRFPFGDTPITNANTLDYKKICRKDPHQPNPLNRSKTIGVKVTESAYEKLRDIAESKGKTLGEWCRERILEAAEPPVPRVTDFALMAEIAATQVMLMQMLCVMGRDGKLSTQQAQGIVDKAHDEKFREALDLLTIAHRKGKNFRWTMPPTTSVPDDRDD